MPNANVDEVRKAFSRLSQQNKIMTEKAKISALTQTNPEARSDLLRRERNIAVAVIVNEFRTALPESGWQIDLDWTSMDEATISLRFQEKILASLQITVNAVRLDDNDAKHLKSSITSFLVKAIDEDTRNIANQEVEPNKDVDAYHTSVVAPTDSEFAIIHHKTIRSVRGFTAITIFSILFCGIIGLLAGTGFSLGLATVVLTAAYWVVSALAATISHSSLYVWRIALAAANLSAARGPSPTIS